MTTNPNLRIDFHIDVTAALATLDSCTSTLYRAMRDLGFSADATRDAIDAHVLDTIATARAERDELPVDDDETGGVHTR